jgi:hypothetical protein
MEDQLERAGWVVQMERIDPGTLKCLLLRDDAAVSRSAFARVLGEDRELRSVLTESICRAPFEAVFLETPPFSPERADAPFEYVLVESRRLAGAVADSTSFAARFADDPSSIVSFANLGGDAYLVVPRPLDGGDAYAHLAAFARGGAVEQVDALWVRVARAIDRWTTDRSGPLWVSTSGLGVPWLHVRLDAAPKYYSHAAYREADA